MASKPNSIKNGIAYYRVQKTIAGKKVDFYGKNKSEVNRKIKEYEAAVDSGLDLDLSKQPLERAMRTWLFEVKRVDRKVRASSFARYEGVFRNHIAGTDFSRIAVKDMKALQLQTGLNAMDRAGINTTPVVKVLKMFFRYAVEQGYTIKNPCIGLVIPGSGGRSMTNEIEIFTNEEIARMLATATGNLRLILQLALGTGLRRGELLALRWEDITPDEVTVHSSLATPTLIEADGSRRRESVVWDTKTKSSRRNVPIPSTLRAEIRRHQREQAEHYLRHGLGRPEYLFTTATGQLYDSSNFTSLYNRFLKRAGVTHKKFHALRHTYASKLVMAGVPLAVVKDLMGHSDIEMTMIYTHVDGAIKKQAVQVLDLLFTVL